MSEAFLEKIYRFPVKGFPGQQLEKTELVQGLGIPHDRRFAITNGTVDTGKWMKARSFFINAVNDGMAKHEIQFDGNILTLQNKDGMELCLTMNDAESLQSANTKIADFMKPIGIQENAHPPKIIDRAKSNANWDFEDTPISIINTETVKAIGKAIDAELDPLRFRGNLVVSSLPAWEEFSWMGKRIKIGTTELEVHRPIERCPTPGVNPETGERDVEVTPGIQEYFGHTICGMYAKVVKSGAIKEGDEISVLRDADMQWSEATIDYASEYQRWSRMTEITDYKILDDITLIILKSATPWPLPKAQPGQRLRIQFLSGNWTSEYITNATEDAYELKIEDSATDDPLTEHLRRGLAKGQRLVITGPFGRT